MATYGKDSIYGLVFLPDPELTQQLIELSEDLSDLYDSELTLNNDDAYPHITLIHVAADKAAARSFASEVLSDEPNSRVLNAASLFVSPWKNAAVGFLEIDNDPWLNESHLRACDIAQAHGLEIVSASREHFQPHVTLTYWARSNANKLLIPEIEQFEPINASLKLVEIGVHGTAQRVVELEA
jgi:2'-5' RNA ligase